MSSVLSLATEAGSVLMLGEALKDGIAPRGSAGGKAFTHWSQYVLIAGTVVAAVAAIATVVLGQYGLAVICGVLCAVDLVGAYYLKKFIPLKALENIVNALTQKVKDMFQQQQRLAQTNVQLDALAKDLRGQQESDKKFIEDAQAGLTAKTQALNDTVTQLQTTQANLATLEKTYSQLKEETDKMTSGVQQLVGENQKFHTTAGSLATSTKNLATSAPSIASNVAKLDGDNALFSQNIGQLSGSVGLLKKQYDELRTMYTSEAQARKDLEAQVQSMSGIRDRIIKENSDLQMQLKELREQLSSKPEEALNDTLAQLSIALKNMKATPATPLPAGSSSNQK